MKTEIRLEDMMARYYRFSTQVGISLIAMTLMLTACSEKDVTEYHTGTALPMAFCAEYSGLTRATDSGFANGDRIGIFVADYSGDVPESLADGTLRADNLPFTYDEAKGEWMSGKTLYWKNQNTAVDVVGYYPYTESVDNPTAYSFSIDTHQERTATVTRLGGYEASDLLWAKSVKALPGNGTINLTFRHLMAGVTVDLEMGEGFDDKEWATLQKRVLINHAATSTTVNLETGGVEPVGQGDASVFTLPYGNGFRAVLIPQSYDAGSDILTIAVGEQDYKLSKNETVTLQSGKMHKFTIKVDKRQDAGDYLFTLVGESISSWIDDDDFHDGIVRQYIIVNVETPGTFSETLKKQGINYQEVRSLKVTGRLNTEDLYFMGDMPSLQNLNMKDVIIDDEYDENDDCIPGRAFSGALISHLVLPDRLLKIGWYAFNGVPIVGTLVFPEGLEEIGEGAFSCDYSSNAGGFRVEFPSTLKKIGEWAFGGNGTHASVRGELRFPEGLEEIGSHAFWNGNNISGTLELPESLKRIDEEAFLGCHFTGDLVIPSGIKVIPSHCFASCSSFDGNLILKEGVTNIKEEAFNGCMFRGELSLPSTVREVGLGSFRGNYFSSIALPEKLQLLGAEAFMQCQFLSGEIRIPPSIVTVPERCFQDCPLITGVVLPKNLTTIEEDAFTNDMYIKTIVSKNPTPPNLDANAFRNVVKTQINVEVPKEGLHQYKNNRTWSEFTRLTEYRNFVCRPAHACALTTARQQTLVLNADGNWKVTHKPDWVTLSKTDGSLKSEIIATFSELPSGSSLRQDSIVFQLEGTEVETYCALSQYGYEYDEDQMVQLQKHSRGSGISVYFVGDGWDAESIASGAYMNLCRKDMEYFFGLPPYDRLRDYFDVYACVALSQETGVSTMNVSRDTKFGTFYTAGEESCCCGYPARLIPYEDEVFSYISNLTGRQTGYWLWEGDMWQSLVVLIPNTTDYTGCTYYYNDGSVISLCPPSDRSYPNDTRGIIQHEAGGHGFGKLADESILKNKYVPSKVVDEINGYQYHGWYVNISTTGLLANVPWADMVFDTRYSNYVDVFEGGYGYTRGVWRPESNSCMNYAIPYYNAISRLDITRRVFNLAGESFDIDRDFYSVDTDQWGSVEFNETRGAHHAQELHPIYSHNVPIMMKHGQYNQFFKKLKNKRYEINR